MTVPTDLKYTDSHEWARLEADGTVSVGITHHAQDRLGDLVYVENPRSGKRFQKGQECGVVESVKAASDIYAPVSGEVVAVNAELLGATRRRSTRTPMPRGCSGSSPSDPTELGSLLDAAAYQRLIEARSTDCPSSPTRRKTSRRCWRRSAPATSTRCSTRFRRSLRGARLTDVPPAASEMADHPADAGARRAGRALAQLHRRRRLRASHPGRGLADRHARRVLFRLHAVPGRGEPGHAADCCTSTRP